VRIRDRKAAAGFSLLELIIASGVLFILAGAALPTIKVVMIRPKEEELQHDLREIREAIDRYKDVADTGAFRVEVGSQGYPPDLETLVNGVRYGSGGIEKIRFLRRIPIDPMTGKTEWGLRSIEDDPDATSQSGNNVYDVYSKSDRTALDGTKYSDW
jgi:general secretion pathway protein G